MPIKLKCFGHDGNSADGGCVDTLVGQTKVHGCGPIGKNQWISIYYIDFLKVKIKLQQYRDCDC